MLIKNIKGLIQTDDGTRKWVAGAEMAVLPSIENAWIAIEDGAISDYGSMSDLHGISDWNDLEVIDASGKYVLPAWCDPHTHTVFASSREGEFVDRINGLSYGEIAARGGGILNSADKLRKATEDELFESTLTRLDEMAAHGTGAVEIKSGYGLSVESEIKMLRVVKRLKKASPLSIKATLLAAHAIPKEYKDNRSGYIKLITKEIIPIVKAEGLAEYIDVFCETNYFTPEETATILEAGAEAGLRPKVHVNQFTTIGGVNVCVYRDALSVDHLEVMNDKDIDVLKGSNTMPTMLPSCSFFLGIPYAPARQMMEAGLPVALATDFNPGSTPSGNMSFVVSLACIRQIMTPEEAINAATLNAAYAMGLEKELGSIAIGKRANLIITKEISSLAYLPYSFGENVIEQTIINGRTYPEA